MEELKLEEQVPTRSRSLPIKKEEPEKKEKKKKLGFWDRAFNRNRLQKTKKVAVIFLRTSGNAETYELEPRNGFFNIHGKTYHERRDCTYRMGKDRYPLAIIPEFAVVPIGTREWFYTPLEEKFATLQDHVMKGIRHAERVRMGESEGKQLNMKQVIVWGIMAIIGIAVLMNYF